MSKKWYLIIFSLVFCIAYIIVWKFFYQQAQQETIKVGILHSLSGDLAISEKPVSESTLLAINEINAAGGVLGKKIEAIIVDGKSDEKVFAQQALQLVTQEKVAAIFGCWTSPSRIAVKNVVEKHNSLLFYPVQFEGLEHSKNVVYTSTTANQQVIPGVTWCLKHLGKSFFLVGNDLILHEIMKDVITAHGGTIVYDYHLTLDDKNVVPIVEKIISTKPDVILNDIEGNTNIAFFNELRKKGITPEKIPSMSFSISEAELNAFKTNSMTGDYATWSYFENIDNHENKKFIKKIESVYGKKHDVDDPMEAAYYSVYLWKQAAEKAQSTKTDLIVPALHNQAFNAPQGIIHIADKSLQTWQFARIGKIRSDNQFTILWSSEKAIQPLSYPPTRTVAEWNKLRTDVTKNGNK